MCEIQYMVCKLPYKSDIYIFNVYMCVYDIVYSTPFSTSLILPVCTLYYAHMYIHLHADISIYTASVYVIVYYI